MAKKQYTQEEKELFAQKRKSEVKTLCDSLEKGLEDLRSSDKYLEYLRVMSKFHDYSFNNSLLILQACPQASYVLGFNDWKKIGRSVRKGEHGIRILAPMIVRKEDPDQEGGKKTVVAGFKPVSVFDISQTTGKELPQLTTPLQGDVKGYEDLFNALAKGQHIRVERKNLPEDTFGYCDARTGQIVVRQDISQAQAIKTLIHEIAHKRMHPLGNRIPKPQREVQAESVAYVTCAHFGIDTSDYTFGYLDSWLKGNDPDILRQSLGVIASNAHEIIAETENVLERDRERGKDQTLDKEEPGMPREAGGAKGAPGRAQASSEIALARTRPDPGDMER